MFVRKTLFFLTAGCLAASALSAQVTCPPPGAGLSGPATITANIAAIDQPYMLNRYGAAMPQGMIFALTSDLVSTNGGSLSSGNVMLRPTKRPRPIVLRVRQGDCLQITLTNYLGTPNPANGTLQPATTNVSFHASGMQVVKSIADDGTLAGKNASPSGLVAPGQSIIYTLYAAQIGTYLAYSTASMAGGCGNCGGQLTSGLFGAVNVEPPGAEFYRSQVTAADMAVATTGNTPLGQPQILYTQRYPASYTPPAGSNAPQACWPVLQMVAPPASVINGQCVVQPGPLTTYYTDLTALITGPNQGNFTATGPEFNPIPASPNRTQPFREFTIVYHEVINAVQAFVDYYVGQPDGTNPGTLGAGKDNFAINYGTGGIGSEILANRMNVGANAGPPGSSQSACVECKFEEFFLTAWAVGDPAMVVDRPANAAAGSPADQPNVESQTTKNYTNCAVNANCSIPAPQTGRKATVAFFPDDPSNVYHSYLNDHVTFRILHAGANFTHIHHQHAHQWLHSPNSPNGSYLDSQLISPGAAFTLEMVYNGSGNRNKTAGDSIFHCHFYPHFAAGMWSMWRVHDVFEAGTALSNGVPTATARALPDGEIAAGTPIPGIVPIPTLPMAIIPAATQIVPVCSTTQSGPCPAANVVGYAAQTIGSGNPGYPFFVPGVAGHRAPRPPMDVACEDPSNPSTCYDGGLARNVILTGTVTNQQQNQWDFSKDNATNIQSTFTPPAGMPSGCSKGCLLVQPLAENGTPTELAAMTYMGLRNHPSFTPSGASGFFVTNGLPRKSAQYPNGAQPGAPFADPAIDDNGNAVGTMRRYKAAVVQTDLAFNKAGWHYPQQRFETLWGDVQSAVSGGSSTYTPQPFFFRANSQSDFVEFWHLNLVPSYYELDDYEVRTPTDILGQHIHLVKFDVLASDGASNGFNYEDGTLSPDEVRDRIEAIRNWNGCTASSPVSAQCPVPKPPPINVTPPAGSCPPPTPASQCWYGAQVTIQRWYADELTGCTDGSVPNCNQSADRTLRTVFTHDHFGPSTHQQVGLYAGLLVEPQNSTWTDPSTGTQLGTNAGRQYADGGPTSWQAIVSKTAQQPGYREFALEFQDIAHAYQGGSVTAAIPYSTYPTGPITTTSPAIWGWPDCNNAINVSNGPQTGCTPSASTIKPALIDSTQSLGTMSVNYRNEPLPFRVATATGGISQPNATDLGHVYSSISRNLNPAYNPGINTQPTAGTCVSGATPPCAGGFVFPPALPGAQAQDPYTPILQAYQGDNVQVRVLVGAHFFNHNFDVQGLKWLFEPSNGSSGYRDNQAMGISEHFEYLFTVPSTPPPTSSTPGGVLPFADYLYKPGAGQNDQNQGNWGMLRAYTTGGNPSKVMNGSNAPITLLPAPNNPSGGTPWAGSSVCPPAAPQRQYYIAAISPKSYSVQYYSRNDGTTTNTITNPTPMLYVPTDATGAIPSPLPCVSGATVPCSPIVLRANAGDCINVTLFNQFDTTNTALFNTPDGNYSGWPVSSGNAPYLPSQFAGLHAQLASANAASQNGVNVGFNMQQYGDTTVGPTGTGCAYGSSPCSINYQWYAGNVSFSAGGTLTGTPIELGTANLLPSDPIEHPPHAMIGALVVEPQGSIWCNTAKTTCSATMGAAKVGSVYDTTADIYKPGGYAPQFREFVTMLQDNVYLSTGNNFMSVNFGVEPFLLPGNVATSRYTGYLSTMPASCKNDPNCLDLSFTFSNSLPVNPSAGAATSGDPQTPIFTAVAGTPIRFRMLHPDGLGGFPDNVFTLHGHVWQEEPYVADSSNNPSAILGNNTMSQWMGARDGFGSGNHWDMLLPSAGGVNAKAGDYLYQSLPVLEGGAGIWGVFRVTAKGGAVAAASAAAKKPALPALNATARQAPAEDPGARFLRPRDKGEKGGTTTVTATPTPPPAPPKP
jgi:hypothetical protein